MLIDTSLGMAKLVFDHFEGVSLRSFLSVSGGYCRLMWDVHILRKFGGADLTIHETSATYRRRYKNQQEIYEHSRI